MSAKKKAAPASATAVTGRITYASLTDAQRGALLAPLVSDPAALAAMAVLATSDEPVSDEHARALGMVRAYVLGVTTQKADLTVYRPVRRGGMPQNLDAWLAGLSGAACNVDPATVVYVRDADGNELTVVTGEDENGNEVSRPLAEVRGDKSDTGDTRIRLADGTVVTPDDGRKVTLADVDGDVDKWHAIREFSRDGGKTWADVRWTLTLPRPRKNGK